MPDIFHLGFMVRAFVAGGVVGLVCPLLGVFLVLRRLSLIAETLAHVALTGAAIGLLLGRYPVGVALVTSALAAVAVERLRAANRLAGDTALALVLYTALAAAVVLVSVGDGFSVDLFGYLFGSVVTVAWEDVWAVGALGATVVALVVLLYNELVQATFDPELAQASGVNVGRAGLVLALLTGVTVTLSMRVVGALLVGALIVFPVLAALQVGRSFRATLLLAAALGVASVLAGLTLSYYRDLAAGGAIVLVALGALLLVTAVRRLALRLGHPAPS